jgi:A/G-specific adenine glycosylase
VVDTNIARLYARVGGRTLGAREVQAIADAHAPPGDSWAWNQSIMELGAIVCRPAPRCEHCPVEVRCAWQGSAGSDPAIGSAGVSAAQARFDGSDRQARGRLIRAAGSGAVPEVSLAAVSGRPIEQARRLADALVAEGLLVHDDAHYRLP